MTDAPKKITRNRPTRYPRQIVIMATEETYQAVKAEAANETATTGVKTSKSVIARRWLDAGRAITEAAPVPDRDRLSRDDVDDPPVNADRATR